MIPPKLVTIYGLCDPRTKELRYVGKTRGNVRQRVRAHCCESSNHGTHKLHWVMGLKAAGLRPYLVVLETVPEQEWREAETFWIQYMRFLGCRLVNANDGGRGHDSLSNEARQRISLARRGMKFSPEHIRNLSTSHKGQRPTNIEELRQLSKRPKSEAHKRAISIGLLGHPVSIETRRRQSIAARKRRHTNQSPPEPGRVPPRAVVLT